MLLRRLLHAGTWLRRSISRASLDELSPGRRAAPGTEIRVPVLTLDGFCAQRGFRPDRVTIEGAELQVLRGAVELLRGSAEVVCELHSAQLEAAGDTEGELTSLVYEHGRTLVKIDEREDGIYHALLVRA